MKAADTTLYWAKKDGRNRLAMFDADRHHRDVGRFALSARMPDALSRGEFAVVYQPLVRLSDERWWASRRWSVGLCPTEAARPGPRSSRWRRRPG